MKLKAQLEGIERADLEESVGKKKSNKVVSISKKKTAKAESKPERKGKKTMKKVKTKKVKTAKKNKTFTPKANRVLGKYRPDNAKGKIANEGYTKGKFTEERAQKLAGKHKAMPLVYSIRRFGKRTGMFDLFPSKKTEGLWIFKMKGAAPKVKVDKKKAA